VTPTQKTILACFAEAAAHAKTPALRKLASEQLADYTARITPKKKTSPRFAAFLEKLTR